MSEAKKRKVQTPEFNAKVGLKALRGVKTINQFGQDYDVHTGADSPISPVSSRGNTSLPNTAPSGIKPSQTPHSATNT